MIFSYVFISEVCILHDCHTIDNQYAYQNEKFTGKDSERDFHQ